MAITLGIAAFAHQVRMEQEAKKKAEADAKKANAAASQPTTLYREPWGPSVQYRQDLMARAMGLLNGGSVAGPSAGGAAPQTDRDRRQDARRKARLSGQEPSRTGGGGAGGGTGGGGSTNVDYNSYIKAILDGKYMNDPYLNRMVAAMRRNSEAQFGQSELAAEQAGRVGGGAHQVFDAALARGINEAELAMRSDARKFGISNITDVLGLGTGYDAQLKSIAAQAAAARANSRIARGHLQLAQSMAPYQQLGSVTDIINGLSGAYGSQSSTGPYNYQSAPNFDPWGKGVAAGFGAYNWANNAWGQPKTTQPANVQGTGQYAYQPGP